MSIIFKKRSSASVSNPGAGRASFYVDQATGTPMVLDGDTGAAAGIGIPASRAVNTGTGLAGGGDLSADRTIALAAAPAGTLKGNGSGAAAAPSDLSAAAVKALLAISSADVSGLGALATKSTIGTGDITDASIANGDLAAMPSMTIKGNVAGTAASPSDLTSGQLASIRDFGIAVRSRTSAFALAAVATEQVPQVFTIPANTLVAGDSLHLHLGGYITTTATATNLTARVRIGAAGTVAALTAVIPSQELRTLNATAVQRGFTIDAYVTVQANGTTIIGDVIIGGGTLAITAAAASTPVTAAVALVPTQANDIGLTMLFSAAAGITAATSAVTVATIARV
jgi:hypothetical protein